MIILDIRTYDFSPGSKITSIQAKKGSCKDWFLWNHVSEKAMIEDFIEYFLKDDDKIIAGYNVLKFQLPLLFLKMSDSSKFDEFFRKINYSNVIDIFVILTFLNKGQLKPLEYYCKEHKVNFRPIKQEEIKNMFDKKEFGKIERLLEENMSAIEGLTKKIVYGEEKSR